MSASERNGTGKTSGQDKHKKPLLCYLITQILTYTKRSSLKIIKPYHKPTWKPQLFPTLFIGRNCGVGSPYIHACFSKFLPSWVSHNFPKLCMKPWETLLYPSTDPPILLPSAWQLCYHSTPSSSRSTGDTLSLLPLKKTFVFSSACSHFFFLK